MWPQIIVMIIAYIVSVALAPKPKAPPPGTLSGITTAEAGRPIPVVFGTRLIKQPNVVWWGDVYTTPIKSGGGKK